MNLMYNCYEQFIKNDHQAIADLFKQGANPTRIIVLLDKSERVYAVACDKNAGRAKMPFIVNLAPEERERISGYTTPLMEAVRTSSATLTALLNAIAENQNETILNAPLIDGKTALHWAVTWGLERRTQLLLEAGARPDVRDHAKCTPLEILVNNPAPLIESIRLLSAKTTPDTLLDLNPKTGYSVFHRAVTIGNPELVGHFLEILKDNPAALTAKTRGGKDPLTLARNYKHPDIEQMLKEAGAQDKRMTTRAKNLLVALKASLAPRH